MAGSLPLLSVEMSKAPQEGAVPTIEFIVWILEDYFFSPCWSAVVGWCGSSARRNYSFWVVPRGFFLPYTGPQPPKLTFYRDPQMDYQEFSDSNFRKV